ncbi:uncharacterized oxidoreductase YrbE-like [Ylistrum balloti]|uniref:uncharacterized oxidoreductase YrbE-like n=1 Tax=Ylistrum balloti TaxID=509963 RepID=UPI002905BF01|nr:uncharacterized oxidoreductase YrbE-like [Ylistrum balloti]
MKKIIVGVLGAGRIGQVHVQAMHRTARVEIKAVADTYMNDSMAKKLSQYGIKNITRNPKDIFDDEEIQAIFICSSTETHSEFSLQGIRAKKHIFCEKPVDMELDKIKEVRKALKKSPIVYQVGFNRRFDHNFIAARKAIHSNKIGTLRMLRITSRDPAPPTLSYIKESGGLFMDMMIHDFDMARFQTGSEVEGLHAIAAVLVDKEIGKLGDVDTAIVSFQCKNGTIGVIENCRQASYGYDQRLEALGDKGSLCIGNDTESRLEISSNSGVLTEKPLPFFLERYKEAYILEQKHFFDAIVKKKPAPCGIEDGLESVRLAYAAKLSLKEGRPVSMSEIQ